MKKKHFLLLALSAVLFSIPSTTVFADPPGDEETTASQNSDEQAEDTISDAYSDDSLDDSEAWSATSDYWVWVTFPNGVPRKVYLRNDISDAQGTLTDFQVSTLRSIVSGFFMLSSKELSNDPGRAGSLANNSNIHCFVKERLIPNAQWDLSLSELGINNDDRILLFKGIPEELSMAESFWKRQSERFQTIDSNQLMRDRTTRPIFCVQKTVNPVKERLMLTNPYCLRLLEQVTQERQERLDRIETFHNYPSMINITPAEHPSEEALPILW